MPAPKLLYQGDYLNEFAADYLSMLLNSCPPLLNDKFVCSRLQEVIEHLLPDIDAEISSWTVSYYGIEN